MSVSLDEIRNFVQERVSASRYQHILGVAYTAKILAAKHGVSVVDAEVAALLHDVAKEQDIQQIKSMLQLKFEADYLNYDEAIWHGPMGAVIAADVLGITNQDILNAVKFHVTGRAGMSDLEKVIFVADSTEPGRTYERCIEIRALYHECGSLDQTIYEILKHKGIKHPDADAARVYYKELTIN
jgi:predicted HD superfamily hydrolase involved in NAD metabolism